MTDQVRSELLKLRTTPTMALLLLGAVALAAFGASTEGLSPSVSKLAQEETQRTMLSGGTSGVFFATLAGVIAVTSEFRYGTIRPTLLIEPRRRIVLVAKLAASALVGFALAAICVIVAFAAGLVVLAVRDVDVALTGAHTLPLVGGTMFAGALSAMLGVAVGTLIRNQAGAIVTIAAYAFLVDAALFAAAPSVGRYLPGKSGDALAGLPKDLLLSPGVGAAVLAAWTIAFVVAAGLRSDRSDV
jgi:ABC-type transport system involved in multi-copper enzyme maturation permease subunit